MKNTIIYITFIIPILLSILIHIYGFDKAKADFDQFKQYDDMRNYYDNKIFPTLGTKMWNADLDSTPRMPGGFFYIVYTNLYKLSGENFNLTRLYFMFLTTIILFVFLFWLYKRFGKYITAVFLALIICNAYLFFANIDIYNPNLVIFLSFIFLILFCEYVADSKYSFISALLMFPLLALMAQCHFAIFFSIVPSLIVYHIIRFKKLTKKYIMPLIASVFISFLFYLPYLISEIQNGFLNTISMLSFREGGKLVGLPQIYCMFIYPTTEMSIFYGRTNAILYFWFKNNYAFIFEALILILSALFSIYALFFAVKKIFSNTFKNSKDIKDIMLKESMILYLIYIPTTILVFVIAKSKPGTFHYIYNAFALSFIPIIILIKYIFENKSVKYKNILSLFAISISLSFSLQIVRTINLYTYPYNYDNHKKLLYSIIEDANGESFRIESIRIQPIVNSMYKLVSAMYNESDKWNVDENSKLTYFIFDKNMYFFEGKWDDIKDGKNKPIPQNSIKIWGDDNLAVYKYIED